MSSVYAALTLRTIMYAADVLNIKDLIANELTRRSLTPQDNSTVEAGQIISFVTAEDLIANLEAASVAVSGSPAQDGVSYAEFAQECIDAAKTLYEENINP